MNASALQSGVERAVTVSEIGSVLKLLKEVPRVGEGRKKGGLMFFLGKPWKFEFVHVGKTKRLMTVGEFFLSLIK